MGSCAAPPQLAAPVHPRAPGRGHRPPRPSPDAPPGDEGVTERRISEVDRQGIIEHAASSRGRHSRAVGAAILVEPGCDLGMPLAETAWPNADPDADEEVPFSHGSHLARVAQHIVFPIRSTQDCHSRPILSSGLGALM